MRRYAEEDREDDTWEYAQEEKRETAIRRGVTCPICDKETHLKEHSTCWEHEV